MKYELAKELKEAGFPQMTEKWFRKLDDSDPMVLDCTDCSTRDADDVSVPTLQELIEACGEGFSELRRNYTDVPYGAPGKWLACHSPDRGETDDCVVGNSATEAVARLWLALNRS